MSKNDYPRSRRRGTSCSRRRTKRVRCRTICKSALKLRSGVVPDTGCSSLGFVRLVRLYPRSLHIGEILPAATSQFYARPRNPQVLRAPLR
jgi:hypothetical protein